MSRTRQRETTPLGAEKAKIPFIPPFSKGEVGIMPHLTLKVLSATKRCSYILSSCNLQLITCNFQGGVFASAKSSIIHE